ncbi:MAG: AAA family ATPase [Pseudomonadota bacterium]|nr:AAA family ATPase [Pseudomonadota bacterium]
MLNLAVSTVQDDPFSSSTGGYFLTPELNQRLNLIHHLIQNSEQLLLVLAEAGCGKSTFLTQLKKIAAQQCEHWWLYTPVSTPALSPEVLVSNLLAAFNVRHEGKPIQVLQESLRNHIAATRYNGQLPVMLVDDAHKLPLATLKLIIELAMQGEALTRLRVVLFCELQITSILATPEFEIVQNSLIHTVDIPPLSKNQVRDYIQFRLQGSQYSRIHPFNSEIIKKIYVESEGIPAEVNLYAQQVLHKSAEPRHFYGSAASVTKLLWGLTLILVLISIAVVIYWRYPYLMEQNTQLLPLPLQRPLPSEPPSIQPPAVIPNEPVVESSQPPEAAQSETTEAPPLTPATEVTETQLSDDSTISDNITIQDPELQHLLAESEIQSSEWLQHQDPESYTLQVLGAHDEFTLKQFLNQHDELTEMALFKTRYHQKDWYVLVYGIYPTREAALAARAHLPATLLRATQPWARTLASIQKLLAQ